MGRYAGAAIETDQEVLCKRRERDVNQLVDIRTMFFRDLEADMYLLENLVFEVKFFKEVYLSEEDIPEATVINKQNLDMAIEAYIQHKKEVLPRLEQWFDIVREDGLVIDSGYFRVLKELRKQSSIGL